MMAASPGTLHLEPVHVVPGRIRLRCAELRSAPDLAGPLRSTGETLPGIIAVEVRPAAETVVFRYSLEDVSPLAFRAALERAFVLVRPARAQPLDAHSYGPPLGARLIDQVRQSWDDADRHVLRATEGRLDVRSTFPWLLLVYALWQIAEYEHLAMLPWYTAFSYALQALIRYPANNQNDPWLSAE